MIARPTHEHAPRHRAGINRGPLPRPSRCGVTRFAGIAMDELLAGQWLGCFHYGSPKDFVLRGGAR